jgi:Polysaccharide pyruvyl transferase
MPKKNILVVGWFDNGNTGDEAFKSAYLDLFGERANLHFQNHIPPTVNDFDVCFIGGGSFLDQKIDGLSTIRIPLAFIGVGIHDSVHVSNTEALQAARLIVVRNRQFDFPIEVFIASDLVFARKFDPIPKVESKTILVLGNEFLVPKKGDAYWKHSGFNWFLNDCSALLDDYIELGYDVEFYPMCTPAQPSQFGLHDDRIFACHVISMMLHRDKTVMHWGASDEAELLRKINNSCLILSTRFHGNVFSLMMGKPWIGIVSHDKMISFFADFGLCNFMDYYGFTKKIFEEKVKNHMPSQEWLAEIAERERNRWQQIAGLVSERFQL